MTYFTTDSGEGAGLVCTVLVMTSENIHDFSEDQNRVDGIEKCSDSGATYYMTGSNKSLRDFRPSSDKVRVGGGTLSDVMGYGTLTLSLYSKEGEMRVTLLDVAYIPTLRFKLLSLKTAQKKWVTYKSHEDGSISFFDGKLRSPDDGPGNSLWGVQFSSSVGCGQQVPPDALAVLAPGDGALQK